MIHGGFRDLCCCGLTARKCTAVVHLIISGAMVVVTEIVDPARLCRRGGVLQCSIVTASTAVAAVKARKAE